MNSSHFQKILNDIPLRNTNHYRGKLLSHVQIGVRYLPWDFLPISPPRLFPAPRHTVALPSAGLLGRLEPPAPAGPQDFRVRLAKIATQPTRPLPKPTSPDAPKPPVCPEGPPPRRTSLNPRSPLEAASTQCATGTTRRGLTQPSAWPPKPRTETEAPAGIRLQGVSLNVPQVCSEPH